LYRTSAATLKTDNSLIVTSNLSVNTGVANSAAKLEIASAGGPAVKIISTAQNSDAPLFISSINGVSCNGALIDTQSPSDANYAIKLTNGVTTLFSVSPVSGNIVAKGSITWEGDTNLYRGAAATLKTDNNLIVSTRMAVGGVALDTTIDLNVAKNITDPIAAQTGVGVTKQTVLTANNAQTSVAVSALQSTSANAFNYTGALRGTYSQFQHSGTGAASLVSGAEALLYNAGAGTITDGSAVTATIQNLSAAGVISSAYGLKVQLGFNNGTLTNTYGVYVGDVTSGTQTNQAYGVYVSDASARNFFAGPVSFGGTTGFNGTAPAAKPTVTGSRGGNVALASLLTALAGTGLITDSTTA